MEALEGAAGEVEVDGHAAFAAGQEAERLGDVVGSLGGGRAIVVVDLGWGCGGDEGEEGEEEEGEEGRGGERLVHWFGFLECRG